MLPLQQANAEISDSIQTVQAVPETADSAITALPFVGKLFEDPDFVRSLSMFQEQGTDSAYRNNRILPEIGTANRSGRLSLKERDSIIVSGMEFRNYSDWNPVPRKATILSMLIPGGGQIYNRKYWKLPIVYGGYLGCIYALTWNGQMYRDYMQAYIDITDSDPDTKSYMDFLPATFDVEGNIDWVKSIIKSRKDNYRRYRDISIFCFAGVYLISVIDAYVDAELSHFDVSKDLTLRVHPDIMYDRAPRLGFNFSLTF